MNIFHTGNYVRSHYNFIICGLQDDINISVIASTLFNIHFRGSPTKPSEFLIRQLSERGIGTHKQASVHIDYSTTPCWENTILGSDSGLNPALNFFENQLPDILGDDLFLLPLFRPETLITDIIDNEEALRFVKERVDFFLPIANLVIEIDGSQHEQTIAVAKDRSRNKLFRKYGIATYRITTSQLKDESEFIKFKAEVSTYLANVKMIAIYRQLLSSNFVKENLVYSTIFRLQAIVIEMLGRGMLSLDDEFWKLNVITEVDQNFLEPAFEDLFNWVSLIDGNQKLPGVILNSVESDHLIDISVSERWDENSFKKNVVCCRTDQFDYFPERKAGSTGRDYFQSNYAKSANKLQLGNLNLDKLLFEIFGYERFNGGQIDIIENVLQRNNTIGILPTGGGKSLCYQLPGILDSGLTVVVCPIKSLMRDQVQELADIGFHRSACIDSDTPVEDKNRIISKVQKGQIRFLFVSPERLQISNFRETVNTLYDQGLLALLVVDEVHCMSEWGHDFRTSYLTLPATLEIIAQKTPKLCLTATASQRVLNDIQDEFKIDSENVKTLSIYERENLHFSVSECSPFNEIHKVIQGKIERSELDENHAGIIFTSFVNGNSGAYPLYQSVKKYMKNAHFFTGGKPKNHITDNFEQEKQQTQKSFKNNKFPLLVATKAFGMGVNKKNVYTTVHVGLPQSVESLYQEAGRAGRDQTNSDCFVLYKRPSKQAYEDFFNYKDFKSFSKLDLRTRGGDLAIHHFFLKCSIQDNYEIPITADRILRYLSEKNTEKSEIISKDFRAMPSVVELCLYRLHQIGLVSDWTVEDFRRGIYLIDYKIQHIGFHNNIVMQLTDGKGLLKEELDKIDTMEEWYQRMMTLMNIIIEHHLNTRVHSRIESLKTLLYACENFDSEAPDVFRKNIESYFTIDTINDSLADVVQSGGSPDSIISYLSGVGEESILLKEQDKIQSRLFPLRRYIESYPDDQGLKLINEVLLMHVQEDYIVANLGMSLAQYEENIQDLSGYIEFLKQLSHLFDTAKWIALENYIASNLGSMKELDLFARELNSDQITQIILKDFEKQIKQKTGDLYELI